MSIDMRVLALTDRKEFCAIRRNLQKRVRQYPSRLVKVPESEWPVTTSSLVPDETWLSREFLVQVFRTEPVRLSMSRTELAPDGSWRDGITWDEIQRIKRDVGFGDGWAVEVYPPDEHLVNVANFRHIWIVPAPEFAWRKS